MRPIDISRFGLRMLLICSVGAAMLVLAQVIIEPSVVNIYCSILCAVAAVATTIHCLRPRTVNRFPISSMAVMGFAVTTYALPLVAQTMSWRPLIYNLLVPREVFEATIAFQAVILAAHIVYTNTPALQAPSRWLARRVLKPIWIFRVPRPVELWALGLLGIGATWVSRILFGDAVEFGNVGGKFLQALVPFIVAPFFIPLRRYFFDRDIADPPATVAMLTGYFALVLVTALFFNARVIFAVCIFTMLLSILMMAAMGRVHFSRRAKIMIVIGALLALPAASVAQDLATAMQVGRLLRGQATPAEIAMETVRAFGDKARLEAMRRDEASMTMESGFSGFSEIYLQSEFFQRLTYTKYTDLTMAASLRLSDFQQAQIRRDAYEGIVSILPTPVINAFGLSVNKADRGFSTGDVYANLAFNQDLGGYRTGSSITNTIDVLSVFWPLVVFVICIVIFIEFDSYSLMHEGRLLISAISFMLLYEIVARGLVYESFRSLVDSASRAYVQAIVVYTILTLGIRLALAPLAGLQGQRNLAHG
ncbi:hypothetical protein [Sphingobium mellinum]|uniref:hypothetical protein n=1 Tax=Sphingobium mellinum TaxID=1387166 RepID=UPI0030EB19D8